MSRPPFIKHWKEILQPDDSRYEGSDELLAIGSPLGAATGLVRIGVHHTILPPGRRTSWPHAESEEEEFVYVISGTPDAWINGTLHRLEPGDAVGFRAGTGVAHTFINNTNEEVRLLVVGETDKTTNRIHYPVNPQRNELLRERHWDDAPKQPMGAHDGLPDASRK